MTSGSSNTLTQKGLPARHIPQRMCVSCRQPASKRKLVRVVRLVSGSVQVDPTGKKSGRGAYLCRDRKCWEAALKRKSLERALKTTIALEDRAALESYARETFKDKAGEENASQQGVSS